MTAVVAACVMILYKQHVSSMTDVEKPCITVQKQPSLLEVLLCQVHSSNGEPNSQNYLSGITVARTLYAEGMTVKVLAAGELPWAGNNGRESRGFRPTTSDGPNLCEPSDLLQRLPVIYA